ASVAFAASRLASSCFTASGYGCVGGPLGSEPPERLPGPPPSSHGSLGGFGGFGSDGPLEPLPLPPPPFEPPPLAPPPAPGTHGAKNIAAIGGTKNEATGRR